MTDLLKAEFYKLSRSRSFWGMALFSLILSSILLLDSKPLVFGLFHASLYNTPLLYFLAIVFAALFVGEDFSERTLHGFVSAGHKRSSVLLAKTIVYQASCAFLLVLPLLVHGLAGLIGNGGPRFSSGILAEGAVILSSVFAMCMLPVFCAFIFQDVARTLAVPMAVYFLMVIALNSGHSKAFAAVLPMGQLRLLAMREPMISKTAFFCVDALWIVLLYTGAYVSFRRCDLK